MICGSMSAYAAMEDAQRVLERNHLRALLPAREGRWHADLSDRAFQDFKCRVSRSYLRQIRRQVTAAILVVNTPKRGIVNYIGANTFAEIAMAFDAHKRIYLLHDYFEPFVDELKAWNAVALRGDISELIENMGPRAESAQMELLPLAA